MDVFLNENVSYCPTPYLQGKSFIKQDKYQNSYLIDPFLIDPPKVPNLVSDPISSPYFSKPEWFPLNPTLDN